jgi:hypothetical protein
MSTILWTYGIAVGAFLFGYLFRGLVRERDERIEDRLRELIERADLERQWDRS